MLSAGSASLGITYWRWPVVRRGLVIWRSAVVGAAGRLLQVDESVAVWVSEEDHRRGALEVYDLDVVQGDSRVAEASVGGLGVGGAEPRP